MDAKSSIGSDPACVIYGGISLLRAMSDTGVQCHVVSDSSGNLTRYSRRRESFTCIPPLTSDPEKVLAGLVDVGAHLPDRPVLYYGNDMTMRFVSKYRDVLSEVFHFLMPAGDVLTMCSEKHRFSGVAQGMGVSYPRSLVVEGELDESALDRMQPPFAIKPDLTSDLDKIAAIAHVRTQKALMAPSHDQARQVAERLLEDGVALIIQELIPGEESNIFSYHAFNDADFQPLGDFAGQKVRTYPAFGGRSTCLKLVHDEQVLAAGRKIAHELCIAGPLKLDFKRSSENGDLFLMEANPRFTLWNHLGAACGINLSLLAYQYLTGQSVDKVAGYRTDRHWVAFADDMRSHVASHSGRLSSIVSYPFFRNKPVFHAFAWNDPIPSIVGLKRKFLSRH